MIPLVTPLLAGAVALAWTAPPLAKVDAVDAGETLLVLHKWAESLGAYDPDTGTRAGPVLPVGAVPHEMVLSADRKTLYVSNYGVKLFTETTPGANFISVVDLERGAKVGEISLGKYRRPHGIELGRSGRLYVTCDFPPTVLVVNPAIPAPRQIVAAHPVDQKLPHMLAVAKDERAIYVANSGSGSVTVIRPAPAATPGPAARIHIPIGGIPMGLALSPDDRLLFAANRDGNQLVVIDTTTLTVIRRVEIPGSPARVALVPGTTLLVTTLIDAGDVAVIDTDGFRTVARTHVGGRAEGMLVQAGGRAVFVSAQVDNKVVKLTLPELRVLKEIPTDARPDPVVLVPGRPSFGPAPRP